MHHLTIGHWLLKRTVPSSRIGRCQTLLGEFDFTTDYLSGSCNNVAEFLSRIEDEEYYMFEGKLEGRILAVAPAPACQEKLSHWSFEEFTEHQ